ncbi:MAG: NAD-dependent deacylase [Anaerolineales bacterium]|nr:NAD-dependent deacylase [Anaerolineales bacterium]
MNNHSSQISDSYGYGLPVELIRSLRTARQVAVLTGSGISAESGIPTFREAQTGLWARYDPQELATPQAFRSNPRLVWEWYTWRRELVSQAEPNPGHIALAELEKRLGGTDSQFTLITQNVDGLHQRAGSQAIIELHGNIMRTKCFNEDTPVEKWNDIDDIPPHCPNCGGPLRPDVVWFGENLPPDTLQSSWDTAQTCDLFFSIGTSILVEPAASLPYIALLQGATIIEVNPSATSLTEQATYVLRGPAGKILPRLVQAIWGK